MIILLPNYSVSSDGTELTVTDQTLSYDSINVGGWDPTNVINPKVADALVAQVRIAIRNSDGTFGTETTVNVYPDLPSDTGGNKIITSVIAGQEGSFTDAVYRFTYMVQGTAPSYPPNGTYPFLAQDVRYVPIVPNLCACLQKAAAEFVKCNCNCQDITEKFRKISLYMRLLEKAYCCKNINAMAQFIDVLKRLCNCCGCS